MPLPRDDAAVIEFPPHLRCNHRVVDESGRELATGRDLAALKAQLGEAAQLTFSETTTGIEREGIRSWDFGDLPPTLTFSRGGRKVTGYPALADEGDSVAIRLFDVESAAQEAMRAGIVRLMRLTLKEQLRQLDKSLKGFDQAALQLRTVANPDDLRADLVSAICDRAFIGDDELPRGLKAFEDQVKRARTRLPAVSEAACRLFAAIAADYHQLSLALGAAKGSVARVAGDIRAQSQRLIYKGFFSATPWPQLSQLPRYIKAMQLRLAKYPVNAERDAKHSASIAQLWGRYEMRHDQQKKAGMVDPRLLEFRWHIEELRVSLYAQELKTPYPVSYKRLDKLWSAMG
jgi:ATP-dependent helicase HrpA